MAKLVVYEEYNDHETVLEDFELSATRILIGSSFDNDLVLESSEVDPAHASLELRNDQWVLQDLGGPEGTNVNRRPIAGPYRLSHGDLIELGRIRLRFDAPELAAASDESPAQGNHAPPVRGRVWFAGVAGMTLAFIFVIVFLLIVAHYLQVINIADLLPPWLG